MQNCAPCTALKPTLLQIRDEGTDVEFLDAMENTEKAMKYGVRKAPTVVFVREGEEVHRFIGVKSKEEILAILEDLK